MIEKAECYLTQLSTFKGSRKNNFTKLKEIGFHFGIGESGVSQAFRRVAHKIGKDKKLKKGLRGRKNE